MSSDLTGARSGDRPEDRSGDQPDPAERVAQAVREVDGVHDLHAGLLGEIATYLPGRRIPGVRLDDQGCEVHVVLDWGAPVSVTTDQVRAAVRAVTGPGRVVVIVEDVTNPW